MHSECVCKLVVRVPHTTVPVAARRLCSMLEIYEVYKASKPKVEYVGSKTKLSLPRGQTVQTQPVIDVTKAASKQEEEEEKRIVYPYEEEEEKPIDMLRRIHIQEWWDEGHLDPSWCACPDCEYSSGDLMGQRYSLMRRLYQVNAALRGRNKKKHINELALLRTLI